uniref:ATP synthase F0 subunit 8 n=1 Tax=Aphaenogaster famelica TaxID=255788 RepID=A0A6B9BLT9_9HYME|nr:ATP synthase F0 subunit 8 [Aphaenogaster famelica]QGW36323.1 ATP synthase F0 subunit 8 [Aphaenogaster famelica]
MPQMMPLKWLILMNFSIMLLIILISFIFFFYLPSTKYYCKLNKNMFNYSNKNMWIWKW